MTHRFLDGHPELYVYPFESQLGTHGVTDRLSSLFPHKYRWPVFALQASPVEDYHAIIDEECRVRARTPHVSKFRHVAFDFSDHDRERRYLELVAEGGRSRAGNVAAFFRATFDVWKNCRRSGQERVYVGYSPIIAVDAERILSECPDAQVLHVVRNPWSAYGDTRKRPVPLPLEDYMLGWTLTQYHALVARRRFPGRVHIVRAEDVMLDPRRALGPVCESIGVAVHDALQHPTWNGGRLDAVAPWGTIAAPTLAANAAAAESLSHADATEIRERAAPYLDIFDYS